MFVRKLANETLLTFILVLPVITLPVFAAPKNAVSEKAHKRDESGGAKTVVLWQNPADIASRNLYYGPGGKAHEPHGTFTFVKEDLDGTNPKFVVRDEDGTKWKVKLGNEARPETVASRITWAVGYYANEDYFVPCLHVEGMPAHLHRGQKLVARDGSVSNVRLKREDEKKVSTWAWRQGPFAGTRELNGLRVVMAVINNWDLKEENNAVYRNGSEYIYAVSDLGASFGTDNRAWPKGRSKGDLESYEHSKFLGKVTDSQVSFRAPGRPTFVYAVNPKEYMQRIHLEWIGKNIPRDDARWIGKLLARLSPNQLHDAFRAAGYSATEADAFTKVLERRIDILTDL